MTVPHASSLHLGSMGDFDWENQTVLVQRSVVHGRVGDTKTEYSRRSMPLDSALARAL